MKHRIDQSGALGSFSVVFKTTGPPPLDIRETTHEPSHRNPLEMLLVYHQRHAHSSRPPVMRPDTDGKQLLPALLIWSTNEPRIDPSKDQSWKIDSADFLDSREAECRHQRFSNWKQLDASELKYTWFENTLKFDSKHMEHLPRGKNTHPTLQLCKFMEN